MKKYIGLLLLIASVSVVTYGQADSLKHKAHLYSKKGIYILPEKGDIAVGIDAYPLFNYIGGIFSNNDATTPYVSYPDDFGGTYGIYAKYMLQSDLAIRAIFRFDNDIRQSVYVVPKSTLAYDPLHPEYVNDVVKTTSSLYHFGIGIEKHRGNSRVQGIYGAEAVYGFRHLLYDYTYGNPITRDFITPQTYSNSYSNGQRIIEDQYQTNQYAGARAFLGVEFFIGPKISLSGEFGFSALYEWRKNRAQIYEYWDGTRSQVAQIAVQSTNNGYKDFLSGIDQLDGSINLFFYF